MRENASQGSIQAAGARRKIEGCPPLFSLTENEHPMGKTNQAGWVGLRGKKWYGYFRRTVLDPQTEQPKVAIEQELLTKDPTRKLRTFSPRTCRF